VTGARPKPTVADLGIDPAALEWQRSGDGDGSIEIALPAAHGGGGQWARGDWVLMRVAGDPAGRVLVFHRNEWECFIDGARNGEFDDAAGPSPAPGKSESLDL
jgi:Domain of unknown function (DUF397)